MVTYCNGVVSLLQATTACNDLAVGLGSIVRCYPNSGAMRIVCIADANRCIAGCLQFEVTRLKAASLNISLGCDLPAVDRQVEEATLPTAHSDQFLDQN